MDNMMAEVKRVEQTIRNLTVVAEQATEGIIVANHDGNIRFVNEAWAGMHGYANRAELIGKPISMFHTEEQMKSDVIGFISEAKQRGRLEGPIWHMRSDGKIFATQTKMIALKDGQGNLLGLIVFAIDNSAISQAKELLRRRTTELKTSNEQLQIKINECNHLQCELQQCRNQLEQESFELKLANEQLQRQTTDYERAANELRQHCDNIEQQTMDLAAAINKVLQFADSGTKLLYHKFP